MDVSRQGEPLNTAKVPNRGRGELRHRFLTPAPSRLAVGGDWFTADGVPRRPFAHADGCCSARKRLAAGRASNHGRS